MASLPTTFWHAWTFRRLIPSLARETLAHQVVAAEAQDGTQQEADGLQVACFRWVLVEEGLRAAGLAAAGQDALKYQVSRHSMAL